jgi:hypothetical protein
VRGIGISLHEADRLNSAFPSLRWQWSATNTGRTTRSPCLTKTGTNDKIHATLLWSGKAVLCYASTRSPFSEGRQISEIETPLPARDLQLKSPSTFTTATSVSRHRVPYHVRHQAKLLPPAMGGGVRYGVKSPYCRHTEAMFHLNSSTRSLHVRSPT